MPMTTDNNRKMNRFSTCQPDCPFQKIGTFCASQIRLFQELPEQAQAKLIAGAEHKSYDKGQVLIEEGAKVDSILVIRSGLVRTCRFDANGEEYLLDILHDGQAIWHDLFLKDPCYHYSAICATHVELCRIGRQAFMDVISGDNGAALSLIAMLSTELTEAKEKTVLLSIRDPESRFARFLLHQDARSNDRKIHMKLEDIAASIGLRPETVSRYITKLQDRGAIRRTGRGVLQVVSRSLLREVSRAQGAPEDDTYIA